MTKYLVSEATAAWIRGQMDRKAPKSAVGESSQARPVFSEADEFSHPFEVKFASSLGSGEPGSASRGKFIVWLPGGNLLKVGDADVGVTSGLEAAGGGYPSGWYQLEDIDSSVVLGIRLPSGGSPSAQISGATITPSEGERVVNVVLANVSRDATTGKVTVIQLVSSAIVLGAGESSAPAPFDLVRNEAEPEDGADPSEEPALELSVVNCKFKFNGSDMELDDYAVPEGAEAVWLVGVETNGVWEWRLDTEEQEETSQSVVYNLKLYDLDGTDVTMDYRTTFQTAVRGVWKLTGQEGATAGTTAEPLTGDVAVAGDAKSGLIVRTSRQGGMSIDINGRAAADVFGVHNVTGSGGAVLAKIFSTAGFAVGGGGGTTGYTGTLTVATGRLRCNSDSSYYIQNQVVDVTFADGLATAVSDPRWDTANGIPTTPLSEEA